MHNNTHNSKFIPLERGDEIVVKREMHVNIDGKEMTLEVRFETRNWGSDVAVKQLGLKHTKWLVAYSEKGKFALVDTLAPTWYINLAALHEMICMGDYYQDLIPGLDDSDHRCEAVERFILSITGEHRADYIRARHAMFGDVMGHNACNPKMRPRMLRTAVMLEQQGVGFF
ncbi:hypothetical protein J5500_03040 [Candidatus Saccharibacteria bacterium]|nr:hypothetical protein [Candidatus Saccharibacteria bacterium]